MSMSKRLKWIAGLATAVVACLFAWPYVSGRPNSSMSLLLDDALRVFALAPERGSSLNRSQPSGPPPAVTVSKALSSEITDWDEYTGRFDAIANVEVRARVAGYLEQVHFKDGQIVAKGDLLYTIDRRPFEATLDQARAELAQSTTKYENTLKDVERGRSLLATKIMSEKVFEDRSNLKREAESAVKVAEAKVRTADLDLTFTRITAPIGGRLSRTLITAGNYVNAGGAATPTLLTTIVAQNPVHLYFDVSEANAIKYRRIAMSGGKTIAGATGALVELSLPDETGFPHQGVIDFSDNRIDGGTGTLRMRALVDNAKGLFAAGLFARVRVAGSQAYQALLLPDAAFGTDQANKFALVIGDDGTVQRRVVTLGALSSGLRVVTSGLKADEWVVTKGLQRSRPGQKVNPTREALKLTQAASGAGGARPLPGQ
jgi:RND family efflux transporter MFP subunit